jgi:UDP-N-acetylmuramate: L-alanyl-gamma-D-glutamyl-meso-diaminopimelate ligase
MRKEAEEYYLNKIKKFADADQRIFVRPEFIKKNPLRQLADGGKKIHISGICGTATGSLAGLLKDAGYEVSGSDSGCYPPISDMLDNLKISYSQTFNTDNLKDKDLIIMGNAVRPDNIEAVFARENNLPTLSLPEALKTFFIDGKKSLVVAGTHGKTTTTGLLAHVFSSSQKDPSFLVGGVMQGSGKSFHLGKGNHFIIEGDEYDTAYFDKSPKFLHYDPSVAIVTSLEFDHADIYSSMDEYRKAFEFLVQEVKGGGKLFICGDDAEARSLANTASCKVRLYGLKDDNDITAENIRLASDGQTFDLVADGKIVRDCFVPLSGRHNLLNTLAVCGVALSEDISPSDLKNALRGFQGMKRRQEVVGEIGGITVLDDFAHHPTAVKETIHGIKERYPNRRVVAVFEPRSNTSRRKIFEKAYGEAFDEANVVYISNPPLRHNDNKDDFLDISKVVDGIRSKKVDAFAFSNADEILNVMKDSLWTGDVVLIMSNGSFDGIHQKLLSILKEKF